MADRWFGRVLDALEETGRWADTAVIVTSDHGHFLGEHGWMGKPPGAPLYDVLARTPLFVWHPDSPRLGERVDTLTTAVDLYATILDWLGIGADEVDRRHSRSLAPLVTGSTDAHRDWALYGYWGSSVNVTDGEYTYLRPCDPDIDTHCYSTEMMKPNGWFTPREPRMDAEAGSLLPYADSPVWRYPGASNVRHDDPKLFHSAADYWQETDLVGTSGGEAIHDRMRETLVEGLATLGAPARQFDRLGLDRPAVR
jgi:hypothetical protein